MSGVDHIAITLSGDVTISSIGEAHDAFVAAFSQAKSCVVDVDAITETDLSLVQLIESARRKAAVSRLSLTLRHPAAGPVLEVLQRGGFLDDDHSDRTQFWLQGAAQ